MNEPNCTYWHATNLCVARLFFVFVLLIGGIPAAGVATVATAASTSAPTHPVLAKLAAQHPHGMLNVIVQKADADSSIEAQVKRLGGRVVRDLHIINAFSAQLPARELDELAATPGVRYLSPDGPMLSASALEAATAAELSTLVRAATVAGTNATVRDEFNNNTFDNSDGTQPWASAWLDNDTESGGTGPGAGQVRVANGRLWLDDAPNTSGQPSLARKVDLSGATSASLSFDFQTTGGVDYDDAVAVEISSNGGAGYTVLETFTGIVGATQGTRFYDISPYTADDTMVRFRVTNLYGASEEFFTVDNVQIAFVANSVPVNATTTETVRDEFNAVAFSNDNGSKPWFGGWLEEDPENNGDGPTVGQVRVDSGALRLDDYPDTGGYPSAARTADLSAMATSATLRFDWWTEWGVDPSDAVAIELSSDGVNYTVLETITGISGMVSGVREYNVSAFASTQTTVRFRVADYYGGSNEYFYVDNVEFRYDAEQTIVAPPANSSGEPIFTTWATELGDMNPIVEDMNQAPIAAGHTIWFNSVVKPSGINGRPVKLWFENGRIQFTVNGESYDIEVPNAAITLSPTALVATTSFDATTNSWLTVVPASYDKETFLTGFALPVTTALPKDIKDVRWTGRFYTDTPDVQVRWKWAAAVYTTFDNSHTALDVKPVNKLDAPSYYVNDDRAGTPEAYKAHLIKGATGGGGTEYTGGYSTWEDVILGFDRIDRLLNHVGPDNLYSHGSTAVENVRGFAAEFTPGYTINQVELLLRTYVPQQLTNDVKVTMWLDDDHKTYTIKHEYFDPYIGANQAGVINIDVTNSFAWNWADINRVEVQIDQSGVKTHEPVYYDAIGLRVTTVPGQVDEAVQLPEPTPGDPIDTSRLTNVYNHVVGATTLWNEAPAYLQGQGVTVAVVDSGVGKNKDLNLQKIKDINFNHDYHDSNDKYGHGTFVAGVVAGNGKHSKGEAIGIAPNANLLNVRVSNDLGASSESEIIEALQWIVLNAEAYNIRVVNLSLNSAVAQSYHTSPLAAAVEILWFNGIVVVVSAGNNGTAELYPPANDPFVITVGATDDNGTIDKADDLIGAFSAYGTTETGQVKPELVAPGRNIVAYVPSNNKLTMGKLHKENSVDKDYFRMTGTSMAASVVTGAVALLLQDEPQLTPDQVKYRLMATADKNWPGYDPARAGAGYLDIYAAVHGSTTASANTGLTASQLLWSGPEAVTWGSVSWNSVSWNSVSWNSVSWNSVSWNSDYWDEDGVVAAGGASPHLIYSVTTPADPASNPGVPDDDDESIESEFQNHRVFLPTVTR